MTNLTNHIRETIANAAVKDAFEKRVKASNKFEAKLGLQLYRSVFPKDEIEAVKKLGKKWMRLDQCLRFNCGGYDLRFTVSEIEPEGVPVPAGQSYSCHSLGNISGDLATKAQEFANKKKDLKAEGDKARQSLMVMMAFVRTIKQLEKVWPEGKKYYQVYSVEAGEKTGLPAVQIAEINAMLGLKSKTTAQGK